MIGAALYRAHVVLQAIAAPIRNRRVNADPMEPVRALAGDLIARAEKRHDTKAINHIQSAMKVFTTEAMKPVPRSLNAATAGSLTTQPRHH